MIDEKLWRLHVRAAQGKELTDEEQKQLNAWYAVQEQAEQAMLLLHATADPAKQLQNQVDLLLARIADATLKIKQLTEENAALRQEIALLRRQFAKQALLQPT